MSNPTLERDLQFGTIEIPDTVFEFLRASHPHDVVILVGDRHRRWLPKVRGALLHTWPLPARLPCVLEWECDVRCTVREVKTPLLILQTFSPIEFQEGDRLVLTIS